MAFKKDDDFQKVNCTLQCFFCLELKLEEKTKDVAYELS